MRCPTLAELPPPPPGKTGWPWTVEKSPQLPDTMPARLVCGGPDGSREAMRGGELGCLVDPANPEKIKANILEILHCRKNGILNGLNYLSFPNFEHRLHSILDRNSNEN